MILNNFEVDPSYFADKYGMPVGNRREVTPPMMPGDDSNDDDIKPEDKSKQKNGRPFFD